MPDQREKIIQEINDLIDGLGDDASGERHASAVTTIILGNVTVINHHGADDWPIEWPHSKRHH